MALSTVSLYGNCTQWHRICAGGFSTLRVHRSLLIYLLLIFLALIAPVFAQDASDSVSSTVLPNGMRVIVREGHTINLAAVDIWVRAGSGNETPAQNGVSHMLEHMLFKATKKYGPGEIDREIEGVGAELNGGTSKDWVHFYTTTASQYLPTVVDLIADAITNPEFRPEDIDKERQVVLDEIARSESDLSWRAGNLFARTAYGSHPYSLPSSGMKDTILKLTRDDLLAYYHRHYTPANTCVVIAGDVSRQDALDCVKKAFSGFNQTAGSGELPATPAASTSEKGPHVQRFKWQGEESYAVLGFPAPPATEFKDVCTLDVISILLGDTYRGRVAEALNAAKIPFEKIDTEFMVQRDPSTISVLVSADGANIDKIPPILLAEFRKLASENLAEPDISQAKARVEGSDLYEQETYSGQANVLGLYASIGTYDMALNYTPTVAELRAADVTAFASKYFAGDNYTCIVVGPAKPADGKDKGSAGTTDRPAAGANR